MLAEPKRSKLKGLHPIANTTALAIIDLVRDSPSGSEARFEATGAHVFP